MADFLIAYPKTAGNEGGYADVPGDNGKRTYCGIAEVHWPDWAGWPTVFAAKPKHGQIIPELSSLVKQFYKTEFWDKIRGDEIEDQELAEQIYDMAVNAGLGAAAGLAHGTVGTKGTKFTDDLINKLNGAVALLLMLILPMFGCGRKTQVAPKVVHDTVYFPTPVVRDTAIIENVMPVVTDTVFVGNCDSIAMRLRAANFRLNSIRYYVNICNRNPKQDKFLRGWINRRLK